MNGATVYITQAELTFTAIGGSLLLIVALIGLFRNILLSGEAREDYEEVKGSQGLSIMGRFFVRATYLHIFNFTIRAILGLFIVLTALPDFEGYLPLRVQYLPAAVLVIAIAALLLSELEAHARRKTKAYYRAKRQQEAQARKQGQVPE